MDGIQSESGWKQKLGSFFLQSKRVWLVLRKPSSEEFKMVAKISAIGILIIGLVGFIIADIIKLIS
ncbi:MAG: protein translocase SEC61 complex subunit gamma [Nanoarchaeota archaeon]